MRRDHPSSARIGLPFSVLLLAAAGCDEAPIAVLPFPGAAVPSSTATAPQAPDGRGGRADGDPGGAAAAPTPPSVPDPVVACCAAIQHGTSPVAFREAYLRALAVCEAVRKEPGGPSTGLARIRAQLRGVTVPHACR